MSVKKRRRFFVPEVVQTSAMDCGPAVLKCVLEGYGLSVHYGRLREACQTDVDGTSIDALEQVARQLGLEAEQVMMPVNHLLLAEAEALPAILVVALPSGVTHFVLVWRRLGRFVQVMDPAVGRRWITCERLLEEIFVHSQKVDAEPFREWALSAENRGALKRRLRTVGVGRAAERLLDAAAKADGWRPLARLDAALRLVESLVRSGGVRSGREARELLTVFTSAAAPEIPKPFWFATPAPAGTDGAEQVLIRGAVLVRIRGRKPAGTPVAPLSPELAAAVAEPANRPGRELFHFLGAPALSLLLLAGGLALAAGGLVVEALLLRGALEAGRGLTLFEQRLQGIAFFLLFTGALLFLELRLAHALFRLGRQLEGRLRLAFLRKIPLLNDRYMQSRPISDMAERSHMLHQVRLLPRLAGQFLRASFALVLTAGALAWIDPAGAVLAGTAAAIAIVLPLVFTPLIQELDLRVRNHAGALSRFYLDALLGLAAVRAHGAERALRREHESLLVEWSLAGSQLLRRVVLIEGIQMTTGFALAGWLLLQHISAVTDTGAVMLLAYWALNLPTLGEEIVMLLRQYPSQRNVTLRLLEPLGAPENDKVARWQEDDKVTRWQGDKVKQTPGILSPCHPVTLSPCHPPLSSCHLHLEAVTVQAAGHVILADVELRIEAGSHVGIIGASGAGKSSLVGLLLGWHRPAAGRLLVDGIPLEGAALERLRLRTAWVDPTIMLWNRSLLDNLKYGNAEGADGLGAVLDAADLHGVLERLPAGLQTPLGEGGGMVSGGEGQRVRFGRALARQAVPDSEGQTQGPRLVILDEPFRGLDRDKRRDLLQRARRHWQGATLLCITHDIGETSGLDRVLVIESGRIVEDGSPGDLAQNPLSRYRALLDAEEEVRTGLWSNAKWKRLRLEAGKVTLSGRGRE